MNISSILNGVLGAGQNLSQNSNGALTGSSLGGALENMLGGSSRAGSGSLGGMLGSIMGGSNAQSRSSGGIGGLLNDVMGGGKSSSGGLGGLFNGVMNNPSLMKKIGGGAAAAGILSMILGGSNGSRGMSSSIAKMGSLAAIGTLAYKAYKSWQASAATPQAQAAPAEIQPSAQRAPAETENNSRVVLKTMIAAAQADGSIDPAEQSAILQQVGKEDSEAQSWLQNLIQNPPTVQTIAQEVGSDTALASEVYLSARIVCGDLARKEIVFLGDLQRALGLDDALVEQLEKQAGF